MANDAPDAQVTIGATIDPTGANKGAAEVIKDVNEIEDSTGKAGEGTKKLVENLGSLRSAHHAIGGIAEIARGGTSAIAGMSMEVRLLSESFEALVPGFGPIIVALSTVVALTSQMMARQQESNEKLEEGKQKTDELKAATDTLTGGANAYTKAIADGLDALTKHQKEMDDAFTRENTNFDHRTAALIQQIGLQKALTGAILEGAEQHEMAENKGGAEGALAIHQKYTGLRQKTDSDADIKKLNAQMDALQTEMAKNAAAGPELQARHEQLQKQLDDIKQKAADAQAAVQKFGIAADYKEPGKEDEPTSYSTAKKELDEERKKLATALQQAMSGNYTESSDVGQMISKNIGTGKWKQNDNVQQKAIDEYLEQMHENMQKLQSITAVTNTAAAVKANEPKVSEDLDANTKAIADLEEKNRTLTEQQAALKVQLQEAITKVDNAKAVAADKNQRDTMELGDRDFEARQQKQIDDSESIINDKKQPAGSREEAARKAGEAEAAIRQRKLDAATRPGADKPLTPGEIDEQKAGIERAKKKGNDQAGEIADTEKARVANVGTKQESTAEQALRNHLDQLKAQLADEKNRHADLTQTLAEMADVQRRLAEATNAKFIQQQAQISANKMATNAAIDAMTKGTH